MRIRRSWRWCRRRWPKARILPLRPPLRQKRPSASARMVPTAEAVRFTNSGSEATMLALRLARAHTGRTKFLKFEGHYHGWYDPYCLNGHGHPVDQLGPKENPTKFPDSEGIPASVFDDVVLAPWNDLEALETILQPSRPRTGSDHHRAHHGQHGLHSAARRLFAEGVRSCPSIRRAVYPRRGSDRIPLCSGRMPAVLRL